MRHGTQKFKVSTDLAYIKASDSQAHCKPTFAFKTLAEAEQDILLSTSLGGNDWEKVFTLMASGRKPEWLIPMPNDMGSANRELADPFDKLVLESPKASDAKGGVFAVFPSLSFESNSSLSSDKENALLPMGNDSDLATRVRRIETKLVKIKNAWPKPFADLEASYLGVVSDIKTLRTLTTSLHMALGNDLDSSEPLNSRVKMLMTSLHRLEDSINAIGSDLQGEAYSMDQKFQDLQTYLAEIESSILSHTSKLEVFDRRFSHIKPILATVSSGYRSSRQPEDITDILTRLTTLEARFTQDSPSSVPNADLQLQVNLMEETIRDQANLISLLENRVVGAGVKMGDLVFQSFEDLLAWVKVKLPNGRFGFIVDGHSFLEFFTLTGHVDSELSAAAEHNAEKAGYATYYEMKVAASFNNLFPLLFGKASSSGMDDSDCLPGVSSGEKWNNGSTGLHHQIMRKMNDVSYQLDTNIKQVYRHHPEARQLAIDCVTASKRFVIDFVSFVSQEYATWQARGFTKREAWRVVCQIVRRVFEDLESARVSARHVRDKGNMEYTSASIIFATLKCHDIMLQYVQHQFHEHPAVSSVITRHLATHFVKPEQGPDSKLVKMEAKVTACMTKLDSLESKLHARQKN